MAETTEREKSLEALSDLYNNYAEAIRNTQVNMNKEYQGAYRNCVEALRNSLQEVQDQDAVRSYLESIKSSWANQDAQQYMEASRQYARAMQAAQAALQKRWEEAYRNYLEDIQKTSTNAGEAQRSDLENFVKSLQSTFSNVDIKKLDATALARLAHAAMTAAYLRAQV